MKLTLAALGERARQSGNAAVADELPDTMGD